MCMFSRFDVHSFCSLHNAYTYSVLTLVCFLWSRSSLMSVCALVFLYSRVPRFVRYIAPKGSLEIYERSWNCFPWNKTVISNPEYMKEGFHVTIISMHVDNDNGKLDNVHELDEKQLAKREIVPIDIVNDPVDPRVSVTTICVTCSAHDGHLMIM